MVSCSGCSSANRGDGDGGDGAFTISDGSSSMIVALCVNNFFKFEFVFGIGFGFGCGCIDSNSDSEIPNGVGRPGVCDWAMIGADI